MTVAMSPVTVAMSHHHGYGYAHHGYGHAHHGYDHVPCVLSKSNSLQNKSEMNSILFIFHRDASKCYIQPPINFLKNNTPELAYDYLYTFSMILKA